MQEEEGDAKKNKNKRREEKKRVVAQRWDASQADYRHMTLVKLSLSTSEVVDRLAPSTGQLSSRFGFAGQKGKNAPTLQTVSA